MYVDANGNTWYKVQLHLHTTISDGKRTPEEVAQMYKEAGFDAIAFTDHWKFHAEDEICGLRILSGCEYHIGASDTADGVMHIVGIGMETPPALTYETATRQQVIDEIHAAGGMAILAHPAWSLNSPEDAKALRGIAAVEIYNSVSAIGQNSRPYSGYFVDLLANAGLVYPLVATDDAHNYNGLDNTVSYIMVKAKSPTRQDLLAAISACDFCATQGPVLSVKREGDRILVDCTPCTRLNFLTNIAYTRDRVIEGDALTHGEYKIKEVEKWVRVEATDAAGRYAWSNIITL